MPRKCFFCIFLEYFRSFDDSTSRYHQSSASTAQSQLLIFTYTKSGSHDFEDFWPILSWSRPTTQGFKATDRNIYVVKMIFSYRLPFYHVINNTTVYVDVLKVLLIRLTACGEPGSGIKLILERHFIIFSSSYQNPYQLFEIVIAKPKFWSTTTSNHRLQIKIIIKSKLSRFLNYLSRVLP